MPNKIILTLVNNSYDKKSYYYFATYEGNDENTYIIGYSKYNDGIIVDSVTVRKTVI